MCGRDYSKPLNDLHPTFQVEKTFQVDGIRFICAQYDKRMPRRFKIEKTKDEMILLCEKMYCESEITEDLNFHET